MPSAGFEPSNLKPWVGFLEKMDHASYGQAARTSHVTLWRAFRTYRAIHGVLGVVVT